MQDCDDNTLLCEYAERGSEEAFAELTARHVNKVYSVALRHTGDVHQAEEITQAVFVILARKAHGFRKGVILSGWLYEAARLTSVTFLRSEIRRSRREQEAHMQTLANQSDTDAWPQIAPLLDEAMGALNEDDRHAIVLRFFDQKNLREVGHEMGSSEDAAKKRVMRALEKLRKYFSKRGVNSTSAIIAGAISVNSVQAAPMGLAKTAASLAVAKSAALGGSTLIKGALKVMFWTKTKIAVVVGAGVLVTAGGVVVARRVAVTQTAPAQTSASDPSWASDPGKWELNSRVLQSLPSTFILRKTQFSGSGGSVSIDHRYIWRNVPITSIISAAYGMPETRTIASFPVLRDRFDLLFTLPDDFQEKVQARLRKQFGITAHTEQRNMSIFRLKAGNSSAPGRKVHSHGNEDSAWIGEDHKATITKESIREFANYIESQVGRPVLDETGLTDDYDMKIDWKPRRGESEKDAFRRALSEQLGLDLVPDGAVIDVLMMENVK